jgi:predicted DNA-binding transcriptional regulator AlpA
MENRNNIRVLNERQFAQAVGISYSLLKKLRQQGTFKGFCRVGRRIIYRDPEHVEAFLRQFDKAS